MNNNGKNLYILAIILFGVFLLAVAFFLFAFFGFGAKFAGAI